MAVYKLVTEFGDGYPQDYRIKGTVAPLTFESRRQAERFKQILARQEGKDSSLIFIKNF